MKTIPTILRRVTLVLTLLFALGGLLFALGYAFDDPGGWAAVLLTAAIVVPLAGLVLLAVRMPEWAFTVLTVAVGLFAAWALVSLFVDLFEAPDIPVIALILIAPIAILGQRDALRAGGLMLAVAAVPFVLTLVRMVRESGVEGPGLGDLLGGSTGAVIVPIAVLAVLLLTAGVLERHEANPRGLQQPPRPAHGH